MNANWFPMSQRGRIWGLVAAGAGIGGAVSPLLFSWMINGYGWRLSFWAAAGVTAVLSLAWVSARDHPERVMSAPTQGLPDLPEGKGKSGPLKPEPMPWRQWLTERNLLLLTVGYFTVNYFSYIFFFWIYYYFGEVRKMGASQSAIYMTILFLMWTLMTPLGGYVSDRLVERYGQRAGRRIVPIVSLVISALLLCIGINLRETVSMVVCLSLALGFASASDGPFWATAIDLGRKNVGASSAIMNTGENLGGFLAPVLTPLIAHYAGWSWGLYFGAGLVLMGIVTWFFIDPARSTPVHTGELSEAQPAQAY